MAAAPQATGLYFREITLDVPAAMDDLGDFDFIFVVSEEDQVASDGEAPDVGPEFGPRATKEARKRRKPLTTRQKRLAEAIRNAAVSARLCDVSSDRREIYDRLVRQA